jgi:uncharacterized membrane protein (DUF4010 family)
MDERAINLAVALGIGLLMGVERERRKGQQAARGAAGIRTFALVALLGGIVAQFGDPWLVVTAAALIGVMVVVAYALTAGRDPGLTTEVAMIVAFFLGAWAQSETALAAAAGAVVAVLLAGRERIHAFVRSTLTEDELHDGLLFAACALVVLPLLPNRSVGPYDSINPYVLWRLVVLVMAISASGYIARRAFGPRLGLPLSGFAGGFVSSSATIAAMGSRARDAPEVRASAITGAMLSTVATMIQLGVLVGAASIPTFRELSIPLISAGFCAVAWALLFVFRGVHQSTNASATEGRAFNLKSAFIFALIVGSVLVGSSALNHSLGEGGLIVGAAVAGIADTHAAAISVASLAASGDVDPSRAVIPILASVTTNSVTKAVLAFTGGGRKFAVPVWIGLLVVLSGLWGAWLLTATA